VNPAAPDSPASLTELRYLDPATLAFHRGGGRLRLTVGDACSHLDVRVLRLFPVAGPTRYLSLRDDANHEIGILRSLDGLEPAALALIHDDLERRYLTARITRVRAARERFGVVEWQVDTHLGERAFSTRDLRENLLTPDPGRYLFRDVDGNRYEIPDLHALDAASRTLLLQHL